MSTFTPSDNTFRNLYLLAVSPEVFDEAFTIARAMSPTIREATSPFADDGRTRYWMTADSRSGFAIRDLGDDRGELIYVWSLERGRGDTLVQAAVNRGASLLDCFDGYLPSLYGRHGFVEVDRVANWTPGGPDVVFMARS